MSLKLGRSWWRHCYPALLFAVLACGDAERVVAPLGATSGASRVGNVGEAGWSYRVSASLQYTLVGASIIADAPPEYSELSYIIDIVPTSGSGTGYNYSKSGHRCGSRTYCGWWEDTPDVCNSGVEYTNGGSGIFSLKWLDSQEAITRTASPTPERCGGSTAGGGGANNGSGSGSNAPQTVCLEAWLVWPDGSNPDQYLGLVCFEENQE